LGKAVPALTEKLHLAVGKSYAGTQGAHTRLLLNLGFDGAIVRGRPSGAWTNSEYSWAPIDMWLPGGVGGGVGGAGGVGVDGSDGGVDAGVAAAELVRRYLDRFGPARTTDVQWWMGWTMAVTKKALATIDAVEVDLESGVGWVLPDDEGRADSAAGDAEPLVAFLPGLDPTTMGWKERAWYMGDLGAFGANVFDRNGNAGPTVWVDGEVVGGWAQRKSGEVVYELLRPVAKGRVKAVADEAERTRSLIGDARVNARFPAPMQRWLLQSK
jgi:hypothetical protein